MGVSALGRRVSFLVVGLWLLSKDLSFAKSGIYKSATGVVYEGQFKPGDPAERPRDRGTEGPGSWRGNSLDGQPASRNDKMDGHGVTASAVSVLSLRPTAFTKQGLCFRALLL